MNFNQIKKIYFLGIGGIGMSALARYFKSMGKEVTGYDKTSTELTRELEAEGIAIHYTENMELISAETDLVIYTPAIPKTSLEYNYILEKKYPLKKRAEILGIISKNFQSIAIGGTHGKTTTSSLVAHIMYQSHLKCNAFIGGIMANYHSNLLLDNTSEWVVLEADEYDRSFLQLEPTISIINSIDPDHLDIYGTAEEVVKAYVQYSRQTKPDGHFICHKNISEFFPRPHFTFSLTDKTASIHTEKIETKNGRIHIDIKFGEERFSVSTIMPGNHNIENVLAAILACKLAGVETKEVIQALESFKGIKRRFEFIYMDETKALIDDYAHHPKELSSAIQAARQFFPNKKLTVVFQPHLFTRTRDFLNEFGESLSKADSIYLLDIYPARELPIEGVTSTKLLEQVKNPNKKLVAKQDLVGELGKELPGVIMMLGAGDIDVLVQPVKKSLFL